MKQISITASFLLLVLFTFSCEKEDPDVFFESQNTEKTTLAEECYTIEVNFESGFFDQGNPSIKVKVWVLIDGFGPGLYLGEHTLQGWQPKEIVADPNFYDYIKPHLDNSDRFRFEVEHSQIRDFARFTARQKNGVKKGYTLYPWQNETAIPYTGLNFDTSNCSSINEDFNL
ncbi:hypothetical protein [Aquimarina sp. 2201CG14-23]|uniref:hypothetical protein n=1 Tax=Aquimarina mycalae TaxID=3040073 RepID=UPI0024780DBD|nr:hypothetical protein [Aquimarina sp. 2201CG14-23]MDH7446499.1 hypothetical protein [Aquimarina sp. 2201CG14-23]